MPPCHVKHIKGIIHTNEGKKMDPKQEKLELRLAEMSRELDEYLENEFGQMFRLHPSRPEHGSGANPAYDGLFSTTVAFTLGYGSQYGRGYLVNVDIRTLDYVNSDAKEKILNEAYLFIQTKLPEVFPERKLTIVREKNLLKIIGDFSLS